MLISSQEVINGKVTLSRTGADAKIDIANPGSLNAINAPQYTQMDVNHSGTPEYPEYNNTLGIFAALHSPTVNVYQVLDNGISIRGPSHFEFQFAGLDYSLNPVVDAANTSIFGSIEYLFPSIGGLDNSNNALFCDSIANLDIVDHYEKYIIKRCTTKTVPLECLTQMVSKINFIPFSAVNDANTFEAFLNLQVFYEFLDVYGKRHRTFQRLKYPIKFNEVTASLIPTNGIVDLNLLPTNLTISSSKSFIQAENIYSYGTIAINADLHNPTGYNIVITAQNDIVVAPGVTIDAGITLQIQSFPDLCNGLTPIAPTQPSSTYCTGGSYKANQSNKRSLDEQASTPEAKLVTAFDLSLYPNPATDQCTVRVDIPEAATVAITLSDMTGRLVQHISNSTREQGTSFIPFSTADIAPGMYVVTYSDGTHTVSKKLSIAHGY
jgi:Secretion system C-terminal sorting domain